MGTLSGGLTAKSFKMLYNNPQNTMYIHIPPEHCMKMIVIGGLQRVYETGRTLLIESVDLTSNPEFSARWLYAAYLD